MIKDNISEILNNWYFNKDSSAFVFLVSKDFYLSSVKSDLSGNISF